MKLVQYVPVEIDYKTIDDYYLSSWTVRMKKRLISGGL